MKVFETERLIIKGLQLTDKNGFVELLTDPQVIDPIPQPKLTDRQIFDRFHKNINLRLSDLKNERCACGIFEKANPELIGLCLFLINDENEKELGYRFRVRHWGKGYGTEKQKE